MGLKAFIALGVTAPVVTLASISTAVACTDKGRGCVPAASVGDLASSLEIAVWVLLAGCVWRCLRGVLRESQTEADDTTF